MNQPESHFTPEEIVMIALFNNDADSPVFENDDLLELGEVFEEGENYDSNIYS